MTSIINKITLPLNPNHWEAAEKAAKIVNLSMTDFITIATGRDIHHFFPDLVEPLQMNHQIKSKCDTEDRHDMNISIRGEHAVEITNFQIKPNLINMLLEDIRDILTNRGIPFQTFLAAAICRESEDVGYASQSGRLEEWSLYPSDSRVIVFD